MLKTSNEIISSIKENNEKKFRSLIGVDLKTIGKDERFVEFEFNKIVEKYRKDIRTDEASIEITNLFNSLGQRVVDISFSNKQSNIAADKVWHLILLFGPPNLFTLKKITGYYFYQGGLPMDDEFRELKEGDQHS
ncbi:hypothetical protein DVR12_02280 [Chitinophaga silvatica]|uniref:Uncharacterized protein n=1 Tax=Chitinophaga silvatica TaxID=2282649 RepID=A0A3E1YGZ4_9BACT|nr:hypothetical protein [Chitinophaga silvatica]RFS26637.1 hypothetical protein DVR12_02280 [Chitinophaga silvatica]